MLGEPTNADRPRGSPGPPFGATCKPRGEADEENSSEVEDSWHWNIQLRVLNQ